MPHLLLQVTPYQQVKFLIGAAQFNVRTQRYRVIALHQRIEKLVDRDRLARRVALVEVVALQHPRYGIAGSQLHHPLRAHLGHPSGVELDAGEIRVEDFENLFFVGGGVLRNLLARQRRPGRVLAAGVTDHAGEVSDQKDDVMTVLLELPHLINEHGVPNMQIRCRRIEACFDNELLLRLQPIAQTIVRQDFFRAARVL